MKTMYKMMFLFSLLLFFSVGCSKEKTPSSSGGGSDPNSELPKTFCDNFPSTDLCTSISGLPEKASSAVKPILKNNILGGLLQWDASDWSKGYNVKIGDNIVVNFSVGLGSILSAGQNLTTYVYDMTTGGKVGSATGQVASILGGNVTIPVTNTAVGHKLLQVSVLGGGLGYLVLPPLNVVTA